MDQRPAQVEIAEQYAVFGQMRFGQRKVHGCKSLAFGGRRAADDHGVQGLQRLEMVETRTQRTEFLGWSFVGTLQIEQVRLRSGLEGDFRDILQNDRVHSAGRRFLRRRVRLPILRQPGRGLVVDHGRWDGRNIYVLQIGRTGLFGAAQGIMDSAHLL